MGCMVSHLTLYRTSKLLFWVDSIFYSFSHQCVRSPGAPHSHWEDSYWVFNFMGVCWYLTAALIRASFRTTDVEHLLMCSLAICRVLWNGPSSLSPIRKCGLFLLLLWDFFTYPGAGLYQIYKIFSSSLWLFKFFCTSVSFEKQFLTLMKSTYQFSLLWFVLFVSYQRNLCLPQRLWRFSFPTSSVSLLCLGLWSASGSFLHVIWCNGSW